jgi:hypothetical protein
MQCVSFVRLFVVYFIVTAGTFLDVLSTDGVKSIQLESPSMLKKMPR